MGEVIGYLDATAAAARRAATTRSAEDGTLPPPLIIMPAAQRQLGRARPARPRSVEAAGAEAGGSKTTCCAARGSNASKVEAAGPGGRLLKEDVQRHAAGRLPRARRPGRRAHCRRRSPCRRWRGEEEVVPMSLMRRRIAERLVEAQHDGGPADHLQRDRHVGRDRRCGKQYRDRFQEKYGVKLGFMSFFVKAVIERSSSARR